MKPSRNPEIYGTVATSRPNSDTDTVLVQIRPNGDTNRSSVSADVAKSWNTSERDVG